MAETSSISRDNVNIAITPQPSIKTLFFLQHRNNRYLIGEWDFRHLTLAMKPPVLIPLPETNNCRISFTHIVYICYTLNSCCVLFLFVNYLFFNFFVNLFISITATALTTQIGASDTVKANDEGYAS
eukprot:m.208017 g.208017  ORF g.208017 m.208017 type:complete len:127 (+) comp13762_c0_seq97:1671-2051(+)